MLACGCVVVDGKDILLSGSFRVIFVEEMVGGVGRGGVVYRGRIVLGAG